MASRYLICINLFVDIIGWSLCEPALPFVYQDFGFSEKQKGLLESTVALSVLCFGFSHSLAAKYLGKFRMLQLSALFQLLGYTFLILSIRYHSLTLFLVARFLPTIAKCATMLSNTLMYDVSDRSTVANNTGLIFAASNLSYVFGPLLGGLYKVNNILPFYIGVISSVINYSLVNILEAMIGPNPSSMMLESKTVRTNPACNQIFNYMVIRGVFQLINILYEKMFSRHAEKFYGVDADTISYLLAFAAAISAIIGFVGPRILPVSLYPEKFLLPLVLTMSLGQYGWALSRSMWWIVPSVTITSVSSSLFLSIVGSLTSVIQKTQDLYSNDSDASDPSSSHTSSTQSLTDVSTDNDAPLNNNSVIEPAVPLRSWIWSDLTSLFYLLFPFKGTTSLFGSISSLDRLTRVLTPIIGSLLVEHCGGSMGMVYYGIVVSVICVVLLCTLLPDRRLKEKQI